MASVTLYGKFEFKKVPFGLAQAPAHFHQLINEVLKGPPFALVIWTIFWYLVKATRKISNI